MPWTIPQNRDRPVEPLNAEQVERIHNGAMRILEEIGQFKDEFDQFQTTLE